MPVRTCRFGEVIDYQRAVWQGLHRTWTAVFTNQSARR